MSKTSQDDDEFIIKEFCFNSFNSYLSSNQNVVMQLYDSSFAVLSLLFLVLIYNAKLFFK